MSGPAPAPLAEAQQAYARGEHARVLALLRPHAAQAGAQALALLGNSALVLGEHGLALQAFTRLHARQPQLDAVTRTLAGLHNKRGVAHRRAGREAAARIDFERALQLQPDQREAGYNLALALDALGQRDAALARIEVHLALHGDDDEAWWLALEWLARTAPERAAQWLGVATEAAGSAPEAARSTPAIASAMAGSAGLAELADDAVRAASAMAGTAGVAEASADDAVRAASAGAATAGLLPEVAGTPASAARGRGTAPLRHAPAAQRAATGEDAHAAAAQRAATGEVAHAARARTLRGRAAPQDAASLARIADALRLAGERPAARTIGEFAYELGGRGARSPALSHALAARLALPPVMDSQAAIAHERARLREEIARFESEWTREHLARCEPALEQLVWSNFHLAYHGENDRELQAAYARLISRAAAAFAPAFAARPPRRGGRRVGLLSSSFRDCTAGAYFGGWVDWLRAAGFDTFVYQLGPRRDNATASYAQRASRFHFHEGPLLDLAAHMREDALDLLIYPELGMDARLLSLAALRLAPRQAMGWGHPVSSGLDSMDAYFTCAAMEPPDAAAHYTEALCPLPGLGVDYARPPQPPLASRRELGLPENAPLVLFPQSLFKIHPDNDAVLAELVRLAPAVRLVMFDGEHPRWRERWLARLPGSVAAAIHWLPPVDRARYLQINAACDLMLDTLRWSGGNTSLDALGSGLPVLTCPGATMRARQSAAMLAALGLEGELVVAEAAALAPRAAALLRDAAARTALSARLRAGLPALFAPDAARAAFLAAVQALCADS